MIALLPIVLAVCLIGVVTAVPVNVQPYIGGNALPAEIEADAMHAVMLIALEKADDTFGTLGGGCIVSTSRIITTAALVIDAEDVRMWFYRTDLSAENRRQARPEWIQPNGRFDSITLLHDIAVITFRDGIFPELNIIKLANAVTATGETATLLGYGFTTPDSETAEERVPLVSDHTISECGALETAETHMCATATRNVVCPGDQGNGLYTGTGINRRLIGIVSVITPGCSVAGTTAFTDLSNPLIQTFLRSQGLTPLPDTVPEEVVEEGEDEEVVEEGEDEEVVEEGEDEEVIEEGVEGEGEENVDEEADDGIAQDAESAEDEAILEEEIVEEVIVEEEIVEDELVEDEDDELDTAQRECRTRRPRLIKL